MKTPITISQSYAISAYLLEQQADNCSIPAKFANEIARLAKIASFLHGVQEEDNGLGLRAATVEGAVQFADSVLDGDLSGREAVKSLLAQIERLRPWVEHVTGRGIEIALPVVEENKVVAPPL